MSDNWVDDEVVKENAEYIEEDVFPETQGEGVDLSERLEKNKDLTSLEVSVHTMLEEIVAADEEGKNLIFPDEPDDFLELPEELVRDLRKRNRESYLLAYGTYRYAKDHEDDPIPSDIIINAQSARAKDRLEVLNKDPNFDYCLKRPDELRRMRERGWEVDTSGKTDMLGKRGGKVRTVGTMGETELVLMRAPKGTSAAAHRKAGEASKARVEGIDRTASEEIRKLGPEFDPKGMRNVGRYAFTKIPRED